MALSLSGWNKLSTSEKSAVVDFLRDNCKIDLESPQRISDNTPGEYTITDGTTSGGNPMKYGREYRIYIKDLTDCPEFLLSECRDATGGYEARVGGNDAIQEIMDFASFEIGEN